jgi:hypothetical protein
MLSADRTRLALLGLHHGHAIRWNQWKDDATLADGQLLLEWLAERGVSEPLRDLRAAETRRHQRQQAWTRWVESMPAYLRALPEEMWPHITSSHDLPAVLAAAAEACPNTRERILKLFEWYGNGVGPWTGYPDWEQFPERVLLTFSLADLVDAAASASPTEARLEGAARFFAGTAFQTHGKERAAPEPLSIWYSEFDLFQPTRSGEPAGVPETLMRRLWAHCEKSDDPDKRQRGESAFRGRRNRDSGRESDAG